MNQYVIALVWSLRIAALARLILMLPYLAGNFSPNTEMEPFGANVLAALEIVSTPLLMAGVAECLAQLVRQKAKI
jgi:hypothetical protein